MELKPSLIVAQAPFMRNSPPPLPDCKMDFVYTDDVFVASIDSGPATLSLMDVRLKWATERSCKVIPPPLLYARFPWTDELVKFTARQNRKYAPPPDPLSRAVRSRFPPAKLYLIIESMTLIERGALKVVELAP
jgi:hypothetical protein